MIVLDSSVVIARLRNQDRAATDLVDRLPRPGQLVIGDIVLLEVLQGARDTHHAATIERELRRFRIVSMLNPAAAVAAAAHYRTLRSVGITLSKLPDLLIATFCLANDCPLLHDDRDFDRLVEPLGLRIIAPSELP